MSRARPRAALLLSAATAAVALLLSACGSDAVSAAAPAGAPVTGGTLVWGVESEPTTLNPQLNGQDKTKLILRNAYESLLTRTADGQFQAHLAREYTVSADELTYTFTLRSGVTFTDGDALDAAAVVTNIEKQVDPAYNPYGAGGPFKHIASVTAVDAATVQIVLADRYAPFLDHVGSLPLISPGSFSSPEVKAGGPAVAGTGPFVLTSYTKGQQVEFTRNEAYDWAAEGAAHEGRAYLDSVTYRFLPESSVRIGALQSGQVDAIEGVPGTSSAQFRDDPAYTYLTALNTGTPYSLYFNTTAGPTDDERVRKAFREAVDLDAVLASVYAGQRTRAWSAVSPQDPNFYDASLEGTYGADVAEANRLLDEAGWTERDPEGFRTKGGQRLTITDYQSAPFVRDSRDVLLLAVQAQVKQNAGIDFDVQVVDAGIAEEKRAALAYGAYDNSNTNPDGVDIEYHWLLPDQGGFINLSIATDPELTQWLTAAQQTTDVTERAKNYDALQQFVIAERAYSFPLYEPEDQIAAAAHVHGVGFRSFHQLPESAYDVWVSE